MATELTECPYCGHDEYYLKEIFSGRGQWNYRFDGGDADNSHYWDSCNVKTLKTMYCYECNKRIGVKKD